MSGALVWAILLGLSLVAMVYVLKIHPIVMTRPPVKKILDLVSREDGFSLNGNPTDNWDFALHDTVNSTKTLLLMDQFSGYVIMKGDFEWMNEFERKRLYKVLRKIHNLRVQKYNDACAVELDARYERDRQAAIKVYENR